MIWPSKTDSSLGYHVIWLGFILFLVDSNAIDGLYFVIHLEGRHLVAWRG